MPTNADYAKINIACKELGIDKRQLISDRYGLESSKDLNPRQLGDLLGHFRALGWRIKRKPDSRATPKYEQPIQRKVVAMWITLGRRGVVRNASNQALQRYVKRMSGMDDLKWCNGYQCNLIVESLKAWGARNNVDL